MTNNVLGAAVLAIPLLVGNAVQTCGGGTSSFQTVDGKEPVAAIAAAPPRPPDDTDVVLALMVEARRLVHDTPQEALVPISVVPARVRPDGSLALQFSGGPPPERLYTVFLVGPDAVLDTPVWYDAESDKIFYCHECRTTTPYAPEMLGLLYLHALYEQSVSLSVTDKNTALRQEMQATLFMLDVIDRASHSEYRRVLTEVLADPALSEPVIPGSPWRIPSDDGWTRLSFVWPWTLQSADEQYEADDLVHLMCALLQGKTFKQQRQAFLQILEYTAQGC